MLPIRTIVHATDFSDSSRAAFRVACALARDYVARLIVLHVQPPPMGLCTIEGVYLPPEDTREELLKALHRMEPPDAAVRVEHRLAEGYPADEILRAAREIGCDVLVLGTHGRKGLGRLLLGSVAEQVLREAVCPVVTVRTPARQEVAMAVTEDSHEPAREAFQDSLS
jgi:nucleotide-binding universal stress UspA family protein